MSDVSNAPPAPPSAPSAPPPQAPPAPVQAEVPVNEAPVNQPRPLGDQAPPKPQGQDSNKSSHIGRREAMENAFARSKQAQEDAAKEVPKRAKPGMGHNQPPEAMEKAQAKRPRRPSQPAERQQRYREGGKFARDPAKAAASSNSAACASKQAQQTGQQQPAQAAR